jgi:hypothetical protein
MPDASEKQKREALVHNLVEALASRQQWKERFLRTSLSLDCIEAAVYCLLLKRHGYLFGQMWEPWILFWGILSAYAGNALPVELSNQLLGYAQQFLPAPEEEFANIWLNVLVDTAGKYLGKAAWASTSQGKDCATLQGIERWITTKQN